MKLDPIDNHRLWRLIGIILPYGAVAPYLYPDPLGLFFGLIAVLTANQIGHGVGSIVEIENHKKTLELFARYARLQKRRQNYPLDPEEYKE